MNKFFITLLLSIFCLSGCAYTTKSMLSEDTQSIYIPLFENDTYKRGKQDKPFRREIENVVSDELIRQFLIDGNLKVVGQDSADLILEGKVTDYRNEPLRYSSVDSDEVDEYSVTIAVELKLMNLRTKEVLWAKESISQVEDYYVGGSSMRTEDSALAQAVEDLAKSIVIKVVEGW